MLLIRIFFIFFHARLSFSFSISISLKYPNNPILKTNMKLYKHVFIRFCFSQSRIVSVDLFICLFFFFSSSWMFRFCNFAIFSICVLYMPLVSFYILIFNKSNLQAICFFVIVKSMFILVFHFLFQHFFSSKEQNGLAFISQTHFGVFFSQGFLLIPILYKMLWLDSVWIVWIHLFILAVLKNLISFAWKTSINFDLLKKTNLFFFYR